MIVLKIIGIIAAGAGALFCTLQLMAWNGKQLLWLVGMFASALAIGLLLRTF